LFMLLLFILVFQAGTISAEEKEAIESQEPPLTLGWVVDEAVNNNPDIRASFSRWEASQEAIDGAKSLDDPMVRFQIRNAKNPLQYTGPYWERYERMGTVSQAVPFPGKLRLRGKIASETSEMSKKDWEETIAGIKYYNAKDNVAFFGTPQKPGAMYQTVGNALEIWGALGKLQGKFQPKDLITHAFIGK